LRQLRLDTADILGTVSTGVVTVNGAGLLAYMNPAAENLLGLSAAGSTGAPAFGAIESVAPGLGTLLRRSLQDRIPMARYKTVARVGDRSITLGVTTTVLEREGGGAPSVTAIFQDITELDRVDELNRRNERLEALAELSASLAHEIKNPLASIRSAVEQIGDPGLGDQDRGTLQRLVEAESDRLSRLLSEFIDFSRLRIGTLEEVDLVRVSEDCATLVRQHPSAGDGATITVEHMDRALLVEGDSDLLHRALFNLILNGVQFAGADGTVRVTVVRPGGKALPRGSAAKGASPVGEAAARILVEDSGPGVDPGLLSRIFDPFFTTRDGGSGLGLPVAHRTIEAHQGTIMVDQSELGGARFTIDLPIARSGAIP
jgi:two-component system sensor histidine kinase PilS (NtrC family)